MSEAKGTAAKQKAVQKVGRTLGVPVTPKATTAATEKQKTEPPPFWLSIKTLGDAADSSKKAQEAQAKSFEILNAVGPARETLKELSELAKHEVLKHDPATAEGIKSAEALVKNVDDHTASIDENLLAIRHVLAKAAETKMPKSRGRGLEATRAHAQELLAARQTRDKDALSAMAEPTKRLEIVANLVTAASVELNALHTQWRDRIDTHEHEAEGRRRQDAAIERGKLDSARGMEEKKKADTEKLLETARALRITPPDLESSAANMMSAAGTENWGDAGKAANVLIKEIEKLRRVIDNTAALKENFETAREAISGRMKQLQTLFSASKVHDSAQLEALEALLAQARDAARDGRWADASQSIEDFGDGADQAKALAEQFSHYSDGRDPRLLTGTILKVLNALPAHSKNTTALAALQAAYQRQCLVLRGDWLTHLQIAGDNVKDGSDSDHYTTFNNSVPVGTDVNVAGLTVAQVCSALFEKAPVHLRIHSTFVDDADNRYHRYWNRGAARYSGNVVKPNPWPKLDARYDKMVGDMSNRVKQVIDMHGRIGANIRGPNL